MKAGIERLLAYASTGDRSEQVLAAGRAIIGAGIDWERLLLGAVSAGEAGNLADLLACAGIETPLTDAFKYAADSELRRTMIMRRSIRDATALLNSEGLAFMPLKGADTRIDRLRGIYNPMTDIDILVHEDDCERATRLLLENSWRFLGKTSGSHLTFYRPEPECLLELHWDVVNRNNPIHAAVFTPKMDAIWDRSITADGMTVLSPADNLAYLAAHAVKEYFHKPKWLADIARATPGVAADEETLEVFEEWGARSAFGLATAAIGYLYDTSGSTCTQSGFGKTGWLGRIAARSIIDSENRRVIRSLFWIASAGKIGSMVRMSTGILHRFVSGGIDFSSIKKWCLYFTLVFSLLFTAPYNENCLIMYFPVF